MPIWEKGAPVPLIITIWEKGAPAPRYERMKKRKKFRRRAAIEPVIGHLKKYFRMGENYLKGSISPQINAFLAASAWNLKKYAKISKKEGGSYFCVYFRIEKWGYILQKKFEYTFVIPFIRND